jgi:hypothetical protein
VGLVYDPRGLPGVTTARPGVAGGVTNGIRADPHGFTGAYGSGTWVRMHDTWVLWEGYGMVRMLLIEHTLRVC